MEFAGGVSGAALGYILGGIKGARKLGAFGYRQGERRSMAPVTRKRRNVQTNATTKRRKLKHKVAALGVKKKRVRGSASGGYRSVGSNASVVVHKRKKSVLLKKVRSTKVSKAFRKKVQVALADHLYGTYLKVDPFRLTAWATTDTQQTMDMGIVFSPLDFINAADVLFNRATPALSPTAASLTWTNSYIRKDYIMNSWISYEIKNMSQRTYTVKMYVCKPKVKVPTNTGTGLNSPLGDWASGLAMAAGAGTNPQNNNQNTLYSDPRDAPEFRQFWAADVETVVLQPGQTHTFFVQGPSEMSVDWTKYYYNPNPNPTFLAPWGPFSRGVFFVYYPDLLVTSLAGVGRYTSGGTGIGGLVCERKYKFKVQCPESAGFVYTATTAGTQQQLTNRLPTRIIKVFSAGVAGATQDVLEENPLQEIDPVD